MPRRKLYAELYFAEYGSAGPWDCHFCEDPILIRGRVGDSLVIHHLNHDHYDDRLENLAGAHRKCHNKMHTRAAWSITEEGKKKQDEARRRWQSDPEKIKAMSEKLKGRSPSEAARKAVAEANASRTGDKWMGNQYTIGKRPGLK